MTVAELLASILRAYPGADEGAIATFKPVFYARFKHREGERLKAAAEEVFATFNATARKPFPIPNDFEEHMPRSHPTIAGEGPLRAALVAREARWRKLFGEWYQVQGVRLKGNRPQPVFDACILEAKDLCEKADERTARVILSAEQIRICEARALSQSRVRMFGALPKTNEAWDNQFEQVRQAWATPEAAPSAPLPPL